MHVVFKALGHTFDSTHWWNSAVSCGRVLKTFYCWSSLESCYFACFVLLYYDDDTLNNWLIQFLITWHVLKAKSCFSTIVKSVMWLSAFNFLKCCIGLVSASGNRGVSPELSGWQGGGTGILCCPSMGSSDWMGNAKLSCLSCCFGKGLSHRQYDQNTSTSF